MIIHCYKYKACMCSHSAMSSCKLSGGMWIRVSSMEPRLAPYGHPLLRGHDVIVIVMPASATLLGFCKVAEEQGLVTCTHISFVGLQVWEVGYLVRNTFPRVCRWQARFADAPWQEGRKYGLMICPQWGLLLSFVERGHMFALLRV